MQVEASPLHEGIVTLMHEPGGVLVGFVHSPQY